MRRIYLLVPIGALWLVAACSSSPYMGGTAGLQPQGSGAVLAPPAAEERAVAPSEGASSQDQGWVSTYPYGDAEGGDIEGGEAAATPDERSLVPQASGWDKPDVTSEQRRADIEACYRYAWSQVERDMRIDSDVDAARYDDDEGLGLTQLTRRMNLYDYRNRRTELINSCMAEKGYRRS